MTPRRLHALLLLLLTHAALAAALPPLPSPEAPPPYQVERFAHPGPVAGVVVRVDLADPRVQVKVVLADDRDPDGPGPCVGQLDTPSAAARRHDFAVTLNASFFAAPKTRTVQGRTVAYFVGNGTTPEGWHCSGGRVVSRPAKDAFRDTFVVHEGGKVSFRPGARELPADARYAVSGSSMVVQAGQAVPRTGEGVRHPRSVVGLSEDGRWLLLVAVDGRQDHSRGVTLEELGKLMQGLGAHQALNLDGGGSTSLVLKDPGSGVYAVANQPSDLATGLPAVRTERPVADVIGISVR